MKGGRRRGEQREDQGAGGREGEGDEEGEARVKQDSIWRGSG